MVVGAAVVARTPVENVDGDGATGVVDEHEHRHVLADLGPDVDRPVVAQRRERIEDRPLGVTERFLEFVEVVDGRSDDGHGIAPFGQADGVSSARPRSNLSNSAATGPSGPQAAMSERPPSGRFAHRSERHPVSDE